MGGSTKSGQGAHMHQDSGETCFICDPDKRDAGRLWCTEHARYEDRCWNCQPQLEEKGRPYCEEHHLYEDECHLCTPNPVGGMADQSGEVLGVGHRHEAVGESCFICDEEMRDPSRLWCREHSRYEDRCWDCQPQLEEKDRAYCEEHGLYEDECSLCRPGPDEASSQEETSSAEVQAPVGGGLFCGEHQVPEFECGICQPQLAAVLEPGGELKVRFESKLAADKAGVETVFPRQGTAQESVPAICEVAYDGNALARITPLASGIIHEVLVDVGANVSAGDLLLKVHSTVIAGAKAEFVSSVVDLDLKRVAWERETRLAKKSISSEREVQEAEAAFRTAELTLDTGRQALLNFGFTPKEVMTIQEERDTSAALFIRAPFDGTLVERNAVVGEAVQPGHTLFTVVDLDSMWLNLSIPADQAGRIRVGHTVLATFRGMEGRTAKGEIDWVHTSIDSRSRMLRALAVISNSNRLLVVGMFGVARVFLADAQASLEVPRDSIQHLEGQAYVFVKLEKDLYALRRVVTGTPDTGDSVAVLSGLGVGEPIVSTGSFTVMSEFLKSRLGAGCVDD